MLVLVRLIIGILKEVVNILSSANNEPAKLIVGYNHMFMTHTYTIVSMYMVNMTVIQHALYAHARCPALRWSHAHAQLLHFTLARLKQQF